MVPWWIGGIETCQETMCETWVASFWVPKSSTKPGSHDNIDNRHKEPRTVHMVEIRSLRSLCLHMFTPPSAPKKTQWGLGGTFYSPKEHGNIGLSEDEFRSARVLRMTRWGRQFFWTGCGRFQDSPSTVDLSWFPWCPKYIQRSWLILARETRVSDWWGHTHLKKLRHFERRFNEHLSLLFCKFCQR